MIRSLLFAAFVGNLLLIEAASVLSLGRAKRQDVGSYCSKHAEHYAKFCNMRVSDLDSETFTKLAKFCPAYKKHCGVDGVEKKEAGEMIVPPPLPRGDARLDLPLSPLTHRIHETPSITSEKVQLTAAMIASCTPDCTASYCTTECKCANTHPKVHALCNPPASGDMANTCQRWYAKCPMFQPVQYY
ncbi:unnamed protein product, partial [Mesorhabditis belari]|uniref:Uncharacterized protein n=1 Tax=Mesorhabditis belari TaxID=2138241 RepID=A0AAF3FJW7_9BILA